MIKEGKKKVRGGASYLCPACQSRSYVIVTRRPKRIVVRCRECLECQHRFETCEVLRTDQGIAQEVDV
jgi:transcriptional regulator NrdR family protein